ncbi:chromosome segregation protein SMC [Aeoliella sp. SH292]|uniref:chromosome segregation protein SMC n=1 Tax=Aeoliella sp. SH292 TaxID=3454464 RepID=UPI003F9AE04F
MLKALELAGFKSFADKTRFEFHDGVTVVVGPNGSGKSNVVDAIKWVLGSQSAKSLRGSEMTDVIFNGSGSRGALNAAEVTLVLDNAQGMYGGEARGREVAITRRVYRSGEGEYLINGAACRLRDIRDLLAGTGIGTEAYSIIEQGKVDALLQASPKDRRAIFEEAAGISRFRAKRQDAARRLARVEQNLLRLSDIVDEVESRLKSVRQQAGKAQRYREGVKRLKELRTELGVADWFRLAQRIDNVAAELATFTSEDDERREWMEAAERELPELDRAVAEAQAGCEVIDKQIATLREQSVSTEATIAGLAGREEDIAASITALEEQWKAAIQPAPSESADGDSILAKLEVARSEYDATSRNLADAMERLSVDATLAERLGAQVDELAKRLAALDHRHQLAQQKLEASSRREQEVALQRRSVDTEMSPIAERMGLASRSAVKLQSEYDVAQRVVAERDSLLVDLRQSLEAGEKRLTEVRRECQRAETELATGKHRIELIGELDRQQQTSGERVREFLTKTLGVRPVAVADVLHVDVDTAPIIEAALGSLAEHLVVPSTTRLLDHGRDLPPGARLMRLDWRTPMSAIDQVDLTGEPGVWGRADQFVDSDPEHQPLVRRLLGRTWIVDTLATANRLAHSSGHGLHFVTADGDVLGADGTLVTGRRDEARASFTRRHNLEELRTQVAQLEPLAQRLAREQHELERVTRSQREQLDAAMNEDRDTRETASKLREQLAAANTAVEAARQRLDDLQGQAEKLDREREQLATEEANTREMVATIATQRVGLATSLDELRQQFASATASQLEAKELVSRLEIDTAKLQHQIEMLEQAAIPAAGAAVDLRAELDRQREALEKRRADIEQQRIAASEQLVLLTAQLEAITPTREAELAKREQARERRDALAQRLQAARRGVDETLARRAQVELSLAKLEHQRQSLVDRLKEDYEIDLVEVAAEAPGDRPAIDRKQAEQEIEELREGLRRIGAVNTDALEELDEIESRFEAISAQYNDLSQAKANLERLMNKLNTESRQLFLSTVDIVRGHFQELFRRLFGGGEADIILEESESDDAMECGVEIRACPPGKDTRTISLLSGGEKTMTCVALLLAMFRSKPSPFCVLDEVDAALDEANVGRFTGVLSDFLSSTQFVVITHSKKTMTGANTLYGVTMQESGISKQVSVRFDDVTDDGFIKPSATYRAKAA